MNALTPPHRGEKSPRSLDSDTLRQLRCAALDQAPVSGLTHQFYHYPARFSPFFARAAIKLFSNPGDLVLDPYMGGGTAVVEALVADRHAVGCDLNELAVFLARVKITILDECECADILRWKSDVVPNLSYTTRSIDIASQMTDQRAWNLHIPSARPIKKALALALRQVELLSAPNSQAFVRCALLNVGQWALDGRRRPVTFQTFRAQLQLLIQQMLEAIKELQGAMCATKSSGAKSNLVTCSASDLPNQQPFIDGHRADLVITSPPYPGIHMLYHRWQVNGRRETPAPFWLADCNDGRGESHYTFANRKRPTTDAYFSESLNTLRGIRAVMKQGAFFVQMISFSKADEQLPRYLQTMAQAGFAECRGHFRDGRTAPRIWRTVPGRRWHSMTKGTTPASREVVLIHRAL